MTEAKQYLDMYKEKLEQLDELYSKMLDKSELKEHGLNMDFTSGEGYIQHNKKVLDDVMDKWCEVAKEVYGDCHGAFDYRPINTRGIIGRIIDDSGRDTPVKETLSKIWSRYSCIDSKQREWGQPYFAINEDKGKEVCYNMYFRDQRINQILDES